MRKIWLLSKSGSDRRPRLMKYMGIYTIHMHTTNICVHTENFCGVKQHAKIICVQDERRLAKGCTHSNFVYWHPRSRGQNL